MYFKKWFEAREKNREYYQDMILSKLGLDKDIGLSQSLDMLDPDTIINKLNELGEYKSLDQDAQNAVEAKVRSGSGTVGDLINIISASL